MFQKVPNSTFFNGFSTKNGKSVSLFKALFMKNLNVFIIDSEEIGISVFDTGSLKMLKQTVSSGSIN